MTKLSKAIKLFIKYAQEVGPKCQVCGTPDKYADPDDPYCYKHFDINKEKPIKQKTQSNFGFDNVSEIESKLKTSGLIPYMSNDGEDFFSIFTPYDIIRQDQVQDIARTSKDKVKDIKELFFDADPDVIEEIVDNAALSGQSLFQALRYVRLGISFHGNPQDDEVDLLLRGRLNRSKTVIQAYKLSKIWIEKCTTNDELMKRNVPEWFIKYCKYNNFTPKELILP